MRCPICRGAAAPRLENPTYPFCSDRCRLIDLGNWLGESYRVPDVDDVDDVDVDDDEPQQAGEDDREAATPGASSPSARRDKRTS